MTVTAYLDQLESRGVYVFSLKQVAADLGKTDVAVRLALHRLKGKGKVASPHHGLSLIVPAQYRSLGCLPPEQYIGQLMEYLGQYYYVALLSAAELYGAANQRPQELQVMVAVNRRTVSCGKTRIRFFARRNLESTATQFVNTPRGQIRIAAPEATALELVGYQQHCGGLDNVATVIAELSETINPVNLIESARISPVAWVQRLGYLLEVTGYGALGKPLAAYIEHVSPRMTELDPRLPVANAPKSSLWRLTINRQLEPDL